MEPTSSLDLRRIAGSQRVETLAAALHRLPVGGALNVVGDIDLLALRTEMETETHHHYTSHVLEQSAVEVRVEWRCVAPPPAMPHDAATALTASTPVPPAATPIDLAGFISAATHNGPLWGHESTDLNITLLAWDEKTGVEPHINTEVDVVVVPVAGSGYAVIDGVEHKLAAGQALIIPKGATRAFHGTSARFSYLSIHQRRRGLMPR